MKFESYGRLAVRTFTAGGALPVENSIVRITGAMEENRDVMFTVLTDRDGITEKIPLPTSKESLSQSPNPSETPYATYDIEVLKEGYYPKKIYGIAIFENTDTTLPVNMIPDALYQGSDYPRDNLDSYVYENKNLE